MLFNSSRFLAICFALIILLPGCDDTDPPVDGEIITSLTVEPNLTDQSYLGIEKKHYVVWNNQTNLNKLLLFFGGSFSTPNSYKMVCDHAASLGLDVVSLAYRNGVPAAPLGASSDSLVFDKYREEICFGTPVSSDVIVSEFHSINTRTIKLLQYLNDTYPNQNWGQYLTANDEINWSKVIVAGHSQGAGHAAYLAKQNEVDRVAMFSGPNDYSTTFSEPANWLSEGGQTPVANYFSLLHEDDEVVEFDFQVANTRSLGILSATAVPLNVDALSSPYNNEQSLAIDVIALSNHSATTGSNAILPNVWTYMFTGN